LTVSYATTTTTVCTVTTGGVITLVATGPCTINASQAGNSTFAAASTGLFFTVTAAVYAIGNTGPGGGLIFLISGIVRYEMAPNTWGAASTDTVRRWTTGDEKCYAAGGTAATQNCQTNNLYPGTAGEQSASTTASLPVGRGAANTDVIIARMNDGIVTEPAGYAAGSARLYTNNGLTDWFLPSRDELNAMCNYSRNPTTPPTGTCTGTQDGAFEAGAFGFNNGYYWSSSQFDAIEGWVQAFFTGAQDDFLKYSFYSVRPVRAF
jgi:hypothetical protein